jgi:hypothetical protein
MAPVATAISFMALILLELLVSSCWYPWAAISRYGRPTLHHER